MLKREAFCTYLKLELAAEAGLCNILKAASPYRSWRQLDRRIGRPEDCKCGNQWPSAGAHCPEKLVAGPGSQAQPREQVPT